ncbi:MAG: NAD(P)H-quinone oxidoreductase subunit O [Cyanobacteriota bacterium]|jgi:hypothetical protein
MADPSPTPAAATPAPQTSLKKGALVRLNRKAYQGSLEAKASAPELPGYVLEGPGEILAVKGEFAQIRWRRPVPDVWLRLDQLESWSS